MNAIDWTILVACLLFGVTLGIELKMGWEQKRRQCEKDERDARK